MGYFLLVICGTKDWHNKWQTAQTKDIFIKIQKRLPEEVRDKIHSFHLSACFGMLTGDRLLRYSHGEARGDRGRNHIPCIHAVPIKDGVGIARTRCTKSQFPFYTWGPHAFLQAAPADTAGTQARDRWGGGWQKQQVQHHGAAAPSVQDVMQSKRLHAVVCFLRASADSVSRTAVTPQQILQNTSLLPHYPLNRYDFTQPRWTTAYC